jgi:hypothetical protein
MSPCDQVLREQPGKTRWNACSTPVVPDEKGMSFFEHDRLESFSVSLNRSGLLERMGETRFFERE